MAKCILLNYFGSSLADNPQAQPELLLYLNYLIYISPLPFLNNDRLSHFLNNGLLSPFFEQLLVLYQLIIIII
jgi:hypothetical protein